MLRVLVLVLLVGPAQLHAQNEQPLVTHGPWQIGPVLGVASNSPRAYGSTIAGFDHLFVGVQAATPLLTLRPIRISYTAQLLPAVLIRGPDFSRIRIIEQGDSLPPVVAAPVVHTYGFGLAPFGLEIGANLGHRFAAFGNTAGGAILFTRPFPLPWAQRLNFTLEYGGGLRGRVGQASWVTAGYKYHHLSNAYYRQVNPGVDAHVFYAGYQWIASLPR